jgi:hypothetical protein
MRILDLVPRKIAWPLYCLPWCAVLGIGTFSFHLVGNTGTGKSQLAALIQQHFGPAMDATRLPGSWSSTSNALQALAFGAKDALLTIDDFAPNGSQSDIQQLHRKASEMIRSQANRSARQRMRADTTLRPSKPPRGLILSTGEDVPKGQSIQARMMIVELSQEDVNWEKLTACQRDAESGLYTQVASAFICWICNRYERMRDEHKAQVIELRAQLQQAGLHRRTPTMIAEVAQGGRSFLEFAAECGAITTEEQQSLWKDCWSALLLVGAAQSAHQGSTDPALRFLELICSALACGAAHVAAPDGYQPDNPKAWGWREKPVPHSLEKAYDPAGTRIGWTDDSHVCLDPDASYKVAQSMTINGDGIPIAANTLRKRLKERGWLIVDAKRETLTVRRTFEGAQHKVLCFPMTVFGRFTHGEPDISDNSDCGYGADGPGGDFVSVQVSGSTREQHGEPDMVT